MVTSTSLVIVIIVCVCASSIGYLLGMRTLPGVLLTRSSMGVLGDTHHGPCEKYTVRRRSRSSALNGVHVNGYDGDSDEELCGAIGLPSTSLSLGVP